jgi:NADH-quinone oxidoreductase subunit J
LTQWIAIGLAVVLTLLGGLGVLLAGRLVRAAVWLFVALVGIAGVLLASGLQFLAGMQLLIYSGGTLVLVVFGIMLTTQVNPAVGKVKRVGWGVWVGAVLLAVVVATALIAGTREAVTYGTGAVQSVESGDAAILPLGKWLLGEGLLVFEWTSLLLVLGMVGAAAMVRPPELGAAKVDSKEGT